MSQKVWSWLLLSSLWLTNYGVIEQSSVSHQMPRHISAVRECMYSIADISCVCVNYVHSVFQPCSPFFFAQIKRKYFYWNSMRSYSTRAVNPLLERWLAGWQASSYNTTTIIIRGGCFFNYFIVLSTAGYCDNTAQTFLTHATKISEAWRQFFFGMPQ